VRTGHDYFRVRALAGLGLLWVPLAGCGSADEPAEDTGVELDWAERGGPAPEVLPYWQALVAQSSGPIAVEWNADTGTPRSLYGALSAPAGEATGGEALRFIKNHAPLLRMNQTLDGLEPAGSFQSPMGSHFAFAQRVGGVPVHGAEIKVHFNHSGSIVALNNSYVPGLSLDSVEPPVAAAEAVEIARAAAPATELTGPVDTPTRKLVVHTSGGHSSLAWRVVILSLGPTWEVFVDAHSGKPLAQPVDLNRYIDGSGQIFNISAVVATHDNDLTDQSDMAAAASSIAYTNVTLQGLSGTGYLDGEYASSSASQARAYSASHQFVHNRSTSGFGETMGYYYLDHAQRYIQSLGFMNVNNRQQVFSVNRYHKDRSYYSGESKELIYGMGGVDDTEDAEVILHEYGHSIQDNQAPGFGGNLEGGALGEGFSDYWAGTIGAQFSGGFQDECLAEWDATSYRSTSPPCMRRLDSTKHYPESVAGEVHADGEMWSAALWQIRTALGAAKADAVILQANFLLSANASFSSGSNALVTAAVHLGYAATEVNSIRTILQSRGFSVTV
jgi:Zn-dependent metalloprotease